MEMAGIQSLNLKWRTEVTSVTPDSVVLHRRPAEPNGNDHEVEVIYRNDLATDTDHEIEGQRFRTLLRPPGRRLTTLATVNDLHLGETECGRHDAYPIGPVLSSRPGEDPYPEVMALGAATEMAALGVDAVIAKGDLTAAGLPEEMHAFLKAMAPVADRLTWMRGNHDVAAGGAIPGPAGVPGIALHHPGVTLALLDTTVEEEPGGAVRSEQLEWLDEVGAQADRPVMVFGHHQPWDSGEGSRSKPYGGIAAADSEALAAVFSRRPRLVGYFAGHTHRNRVRYLPTTGSVPWVEVASTKDFPGGWAEYRIYEGGIVQIFHRTSTPAALSWSERTRCLFGGLFPVYSFGTLGDRCFTLAVD